jgi:hypothetical protein
MSAFKILSIFTTCIFIIFFDSSAQINDSLPHQLSKKWINAKTCTLKLADLMPEEAYHYKPVPEVMSFKEQLSHMAGNMQWLSSAYLFITGEISKLDTANMDKKAVLKYISDAYSAFPGVSNTGLF